MVHRNCYTFPMSELDRVLDLLPATRGQIAAALGLTSEAAGYHLKKMERAGVVEQRKLPKDIPGPGRRKIEFFLVGERPQRPPDRECGVCGKLQAAEHFAAGREGRALCCKDCYAERPLAVREFRARNDRLKASLRRLKGCRTADPIIQEYARIIERDPCVYCGGQMTVVDHIEPISRLGLHEWDNLTPACGSCNARKSARTLLAFLGSLEG